MSRLRARATTGKDRFPCPRRNAARRRLADRAAVHVLPTPLCGDGGMTTRTLQIRLHPELARAAEDLARARDITIGQLTRDLLSREISRTRNARPPVRADERLVAPLRARLAADLAAADGWADL